MALEMFFYLPGANPAEWPREMALSTDLSADNKNPDDINC
jgi:hypothetical protein